MKLKLLHLISVATFLFAAFAGRSGDESLEQARSEDFLLPLKVGNSWVYKSFELDPTTGDTTSFTEDSLRIIGTTTIRGSLYFVLSSDTNKDVAQNRSDGLFIADYDPHFDEFFDDLFFKFPAQNGESYTYDLIDGGQVRVKVTNETVTVPAGTFHSYVYQFIDLPLESVFYFAPGVGLIHIKNLFNGVLLSFKLVE